MISNKDLIYTEMNYIAQTVPGKEFRQAYFILRNTLKPELLK